MGTSKLTKTLFEKQVQTSPLEEGRIVWFSPKASFVGLEDLSRFVTILCHGALAFYSLAKPDASRLDSSFLVWDLVWVRVRRKPGTDPFECIPGHPCRWQSGKAQAAANWKPNRQDLHRTAADDTVFCTFYDVNGGNSGGDRFFFKVQLDARFRARSCPCS